jgi:raffinose/stachyose/melibiose transport system substrate-binding protein
MKKALLVMICLILGLSLFGCGTVESNVKSNESGSANQSDEKVTLNFFTALADRSNGAGKVEQQIIDAYMKENPNITIKVEALQDEPYKNKVKVYASSDEMPDIVQVWGQPSFIDPLISNEVLMQLNLADFPSEFIPGSTDGFSKNEKLYGLPRNSDFFVLYYNQKIFADNGINPPQSTADFVQVVKQLRDKNINPIAINGMDGWSLPIWFEYELQRQSGKFNMMDQALSGTKSFSDPNVVQAATNMLELATSGAFADGYLTADYGAARNLFGQEQAAMYLMGNWEAGLSTDENFTESFRSNVGALAYPASSQGKGTDVAAWFGGGYAISNSSKNKEAAIDFLKYFFKPENWAKQLWQSGAGTPAQKFDAFLTGNETELQKDLITIFNSITSSSGTPVLDLATDEFKQNIISLHQKLLTNSVSPEEFANQLEQAAAKTRK